MPSNMSDPRVVALAAEHRLPEIYLFRQFAVADWSSTAPT